MSFQQIVLGIDPGLKGALAFYVPASKELSFYDMPLRKNSISKKNVINIPTLNRTIGLYASGINFAAIEDVASMPNDGVVSAFRFGFGTGILHGVVAAHGIKIVPIKAGVWKSALGLDRVKANSIALAKKLFPDNAAQFTKSKDGRAEAALIAHFAAERFL